MLSNFKIFKSDKLGEAGRYIFFVRNTTDIYRFDADSPNGYKEEFVGKASDSIIAFSVTSRNLRKKDRYTNPDQGTAGDVEKGQEVDENTFYVTCLDESMNVSIFTNKNGGKISSHKLQLTSAMNIPNDVKRKDLFGMGYPYHIRLYAEQYMVITSDYGVMFLEVQGLA